MRETTRRIIAYSAAVIMVIAAVAAVVWSSMRSREMVCSELEVVIADKASRLWVTEQEMVSWIAQHQLNPVGKNLNEVDYHAIEQCVASHPMVRLNECFPTVSGKICVTLKQRIPMMKVLSTDGGYYIDTQRKRMPLNARIQTPMPTFTGHVGERAATHEYFDFAVWLTKNNYWRDRIANIDVENPHYIVLTQQHTPTQIVLGDISGFEKKLKRLQIFYTEGAEWVENKQYREVDVRYDGQVIGR